MGKKLKSVIVRAMSRDELKNVIELWAIDTVDRRNRGSMARSVGKRHDIDAEFLLGQLPEAKVKDVCEARGTILTEVVVATAEAFDLSLTELHNDSTSIRFCGQYPYLACALD
jgi:hypothetical protein